MIFEDGIFKFRQSWLNTAQNCPEEGRRLILEESGNTDETLIGTAAHYGIEQVLLNNYPSYAIESAVREYWHIDPDGEIAEGFRFTKRESIEEMIELSVRCALAWIDGIYPHLPLGQPYEVEKSFDVQLFEYRGYPIHLKGQIDFVGSEVWDWKTSGSDYSQKKKQMWAIQPTAYSAALVHGSNWSYPVKFKYGVMIKRKGDCKTQIVEVERSVEHENWMKRRMATWVDMFLDFGTDRSWPMVDEDNWLCSATWCDFYQDCRGKYISRQSDLFGYTPK